MLMAVVVIVIVVMMLIAMLVILLGDLPMQQTYLRGVRGCTSDRARGR